MNKLFTLIFWISLGVSILTAFWFILHGAIYFHTDIARDFLLVEDIAVNKKFTLIGPHSGGIEGVFHGPAWLYLHVPAFVIGRGNPIIVGWFWAFLIMTSIGIVYWTAKKLADTKTAMIAAAIYALIISESASNLFNPFGAVLLSPLFFYFLISYFQKNSFIHLLISLFFIGLIIQFQMAWGVPILILTIPLLFHHFLIKKMLIHISSFAILLIPLSTFIVFDIRHQFLQFKSVLQYVTHTSIQTNRLIFTPLTYIYFLIFIVLAIYVRAKKIRLALPLVFIIYFSVGYFVLTLFYKGTIWGYYLTPFIPLLCIAIGFVFKYIQKKLLMPLFILIVTPLLFMNIKNLYVHNDSYFKNNTSFWQFYLNQAKIIYSDAESEFGWYVYSADQYGYSPKYAMHYVQRSNSKKGYSFEKKKVTYLIITPSTNRYTNAQDWKKDKVRIARKPDKTFIFQGGMYVEKYVLSEEELKVPSASDLIQDLTFR